MTSAHHLPAGKAASGPYAVDITPERAGWGHSSLRVLELPPGGTHLFATGDSEWIVLPARAAAAPSPSPTTRPRDVRTARPGERVQRRQRLRRTCRATRPSTLTSADGGRFALTGARCSRRLPARYGPAESVPVELRGTGNCSRQVNNFGAAGRLRVRQAHRRRGDHPRRQLVLVPAAQARRVPARRGVGAGGDLLLRDRRPRGHAPASATSGSRRPATAAAPTCSPRCAAATPS